jgi:hypothetical protein
VSAASNPALTQAANATVAAMVVFILFMSLLWLFYFTLRLKQFNHRSRVSSIRQQPPATAPKMKSPGRVG